jgi:hypothetical protein
MGLFSSVLHLRDIERDSLIAALDIILEDAGFVRERLGAVPALGPHTLLEYDSAAAAGPCYAASPFSCRWVTLIQTSFNLPTAPHLSDLSRRLSSALSCFALALIVHDDDLFLYNLDYNGNALDGYNSCPQYFEDKRMSEADIEQQRHSPEPFAEILPPGRTVEELRAILSRGWWHAHDTDKLDRNGIPLGDDDGYVFEGERMTAFGNLLKLHGSRGSYPYAAWGDGQAAIDWQSFLAIHYRPALDSER